VNRRIALVGICLIVISSCRSGARSANSFDEICGQVAGKTAVEVEALLGSPDAREKLPIGDWRWIWWNYTFLDGDNYPPELRGKVVHLEIMFSSPMQTDVPDSQWRVGGPLAVSYAISQSTSGAL
jgi:hypothetical protein